jgi:hypothetical protein
VPLSRPSLPESGALVAPVLAAALFLAGWSLLHHGWYTRGQIVDTPVYERYGNAIESGAVPYRDFRLEYPPGALPVFVVPALASDRGDAKGFRDAFEVAIAFFGAAGAAFVALALRTLRAPPRRFAAAVAVAALGPLALGSVVLTRFDLYPAALTAAALAALVAGRDRLGFAVLGAAVAVKLYPVVLLPLALAYAWRRRGRRETLLCLGVFAAVVAAVFLPFLALAPDGVASSLGRQLGRPLQIESLGSGFLLAAHHAFGLGITMRSSHGSQNLAGAGPDAVAAALSALQLAALALVWVAFGRGPATPERLVRFAAAALVAFVALGKVLSPQFLIWLLPAVPLVRGRRGLAASGLLLAACVLTQLWFPYRYWELALHFDAVSSWLVLARDLVLVALLASLLWPERRAYG